jgi:hypothetical protein
MLLYKFGFIILIVISLSAICRKKNKNQCPNSQTPLTGYLCERGNNREDCPSTHECITACNDAYAICCLLSQQFVRTSVKTEGYCPRNCITSVL